MILFYCRLICILAFKHWHPHPVGHSFSLLNHSVKWAVWPPCPHARQKFDKPTTKILNCYKIYMINWFFCLSATFSSFDYFMVASFFWGRTFCRKTCKASLFRLETNTSAKWKGLDIKTQTCGIEVEIPKTSQQLRPPKYTHFKFINLFFK